MSVRIFSLSLLSLSLMMVGNASAIVMSGTYILPDEPWDDFAYHNVLQVGGTSGVYIGNGWVLTAGHVTPANINVQGTTYYYDGANSYRLKNPTGYEGVDSIYTDLRLFRLTEKPDLPEVQLADHSPSLGSMVYYVGYGKQRTSDILYWNKQGDQWVPSSTSTYYWGYTTDYLTGMSWGTNFTRSDGSGPSQDTNIITAGNYDMIALKTVFNSSDGVAQAVGGDSGSAMFYEDPVDGWVLAGIVSSITTYENAPTQAFVNSATYSVDLSFYLDEMDRIMFPIPGDANRDGIVDGSDATILAEHWQQSTSLGSTVGDFNEDGIVDGSDATLLAAHWQEGEGDASTADFMVPEPSVWIMLLGMFLFAISRFWKSSNY